MRSKREPGSGGVRVRRQVRVQVPGPAQTSAAETDACLRAIAANTPDHVIVQDRDLRYRLVLNPQLGLTEAGMLGRTDSELLAQADADALTAVKQQVLATGKPVRLETSLQSLHGGTESFEGIYLPKFDAAGRVDGVIGYFRNTTARRRLEAVLEARVRLGEYALGHSLDELLTRTLDEAERLTDSRIGFFHFVAPDQTSLSLQTWSTNTLQRMCTAEGKHRHYPAAEAGVWVDALRERRPVIHNDYASLPHRRGLPPGHAPVVRELVVPVLRNDQVVALLGVGNKSVDYEPADIESVSRLANLAWDVVQAKRAEEATARLGQEWQATFDATNDAIWLLDPEHRVVRSNRMADRLFPRPGGNGATRRCWELVHRTTGPIPDCPVERARQSLRRETLELQVGELWYEIIGDPILDASGQYAGAVHILADITERRRAEADLRAKNAELATALATVKSLRGLLPICASCKKIRDDQGYWNQVERYIEEHSNATFTHGLCPECARSYFPESDEDGGS